MGDIFAARSGHQEVSIGSIAKILVRGIASTKTDQWSLPSQSLPPLVSSNFFSLIFFAPFLQQPVDLLGCNTL